MTWRFTRKRRHTLSPLRFQACMLPVSYHFHFVSLLAYVRFWPFPNRFKMHGAAFPVSAHIGVKTGNEAPCSASCPHA